MDLNLTRTQLVMIKDCAASAILNIDMRRNLINGGWPARPGDDAMDERRRDWVAIRTKVEMAQPALEHSVARDPLQT